MRGFEDGGRCPAPSRPKGELVRHRIPRPSPALVVAMHRPARRTGRNGSRSRLPARAEEQRRHAADQAERRDGAEDQPERRPHRACARRLAALGRLQVGADPGRTRGRLGQPAGRAGGRAGNDAVGEGSETGTLVRSAGTGATRTGVGFYDVTFNRAVNTAALATVGSDTLFYIPRPVSLTVNASTVRFA